MSAWRVRSKSSGGRSVVGAGVIALSLSLILGGCALLSAFDPERPAPRPAPPHPTAPMTRPEPLPAIPADASSSATGSPAAPTAPAPTTSPTRTDPAPSTTAPSADIPAGIDPAIRRQLEAIDAQLSAMRGAQAIGAGLAPVAAVAAPATGGLSELVYGLAAAAVAGGIAALRDRRVKLLEYAITQLHNESDTGAAPMVKDAKAKAIIASVTGERSG